MDKVHFYKETSEGKRFVGAVTLLTTNLEDKIIRATDPEQFERLVAEAIRAEEKELEVVQRTRSFYVKDDRTWAQSFQLDHHLHANIVYLLTKEGKVWAYRVRMPDKRFDPLAPQRQRPATAEAKT